MPNDKKPSRFQPDTDEERIYVTRMAIDQGPTATESDRKLLGLTPYDPDISAENLAPLNNMIRAAMLNSKSRRRLQSEQVEKYCNNDPDAIAAAKAFMSTMSIQLAEPRRNFIALIEDLANVTPEKDEAFPESRWRRGMHETLLKSLEDKRKDLAVDLCIASWNCGLMPPNTVNQYLDTNAKTMVAYGRGEEMVRITSRSVCRMATMERLTINPIQMIALKEKLEERLNSIDYTPNATATSMARRIVTMIGVERLQEAVGRPESENPKDGLMASYCEEIHDNLPRSPR